MPDQPMFESLEGLRGTGKTTIAPMLAAARGAVLVPTVPTNYQPLRRQVDQRENVEARMCLYLSALFTVTEEIRRNLAAGSPVVIESYFARCLATHHAFGARLGIELPPDLPQPVTYQLLCNEEERHRRLATRTKTASRWDVLSEAYADRINAAYGRFPIRPIDTSHLRPTQVVDTILTLDQEGHRGADTEPVGTHPHLFSPVPRDLAGTHQR